MDNSYFKKMQIYAIVYDKKVSMKMRRISADRLLFYREKVEYFYNEYKIKDLWI